MLLLYFWFSLSLTSLMSGSVASDLVLIFLFTFLFVEGCDMVGHLPRTAIEHRVTNL